MRRTDFSQPSNASRFSGVWRIVRWLAGALLLGIIGLLVYADGLRRDREATAPADLAPLGGRWVDAGDARLFMQEWGPTHGPLLLLVHGTGAWSGTWFELPETLAAAGWHVVATDLPPFGFSRTNAPSAEADLTRAAQARRLLALIDHLIDAPANRQHGRGVTLVGHSFGAGPALEAALLGGSRLRRVVLVDPALGLGPDGEAPKCTPRGVADVLLAIAPVRLALIGDIVTQPRFTASLLSQFVFRKEAVNAARVPAYQRPFGQPGTSERLGDWARVFAQASCETARSLSPQLLTDWSAGGPPLNLIWGEQDSVTPLAQGHALKTWMPRAELVVIPQVGHIPHIEAPAAFAQALLQAVGRP
jgi:pimeloyl-ACP methyl ester carboxylesterase